MSKVVECVCETENPSLLSVARSLECCFDFGGKLIFTFFRLYLLLLFLLLIRFELVPTPTLVLSSPGRFIFSSTN